MNATSELLGLMRLAARTVGQARDYARDTWEDGQTILAPAKADEMRKLVRDTYDAMQELGIISGKFENIANARRAQVNDVITPTS